MTTTTRTRFMQYMNAVENIIGHTITGDTIETKITELQKHFKQNRQHAEIIRSYAQGTYRIFLTQNHKNPSQTNIQESTTHYIFTTLLQRLTGTDRIDPPKIHHWIPLCYLRQFHGKKIPTRSRLVSAIEFAPNNETFYKEINDSHFTHGVTPQGIGYYDITVEDFFGSLEVQYIEGVKRLKNTQNSKFIYGDYIKLYAFFIAQNVRNPRTTKNGTHFPIRTLPELVTELIKTLDHEPTPHANFITTEQPVGFTPYVPTRHIKLNNDTQIMVFHCSNHQVFTISNTPITTEQAHKASHIARNQMIRHAKRTNGTIYGVRHTDIQTN